MAFIRKSSGTYKWPLIVRYPSETKVGAFDEHSMTIVFRRLKATETIGLNNFDLMVKAVAGWDGFNDTEGEPVPFTVEALKEIMTEDEFFMICLVDAYLDAFAKARTGN